MRTNNNNKIKYLAQKAGLKKVFAILCDEVEYRAIGIGDGNEPPTRNRELVASQHPTRS